MFYNHWNRFTVYWLSKSHLIEPSRGQARRLVYTFSLVNYNINAKRVRSMTFKYIKLRTTREIGCLKYDLAAIGSTWSNDTFGIKAEQSYIPLQFAFSADSSFYNNWPSGHFLLDAIKRLNRKASKTSIEQRSNVGQIASEISQSSLKRQSKRTFLLSERCRFSTLSNRIHTARKPLFLTINLTLRWPTKLDFIPRYWSTDKWSSRFLKGTKGL